MQYLGLVWIALWITGLVGWCMNIWKLVEVLSVSGTAGVLELIRVAGILLAPLGSVLGLFV
jgi:hypothetical protein